MRDPHFMALALAQASEAAAQGEIPVGAVIVRHGQVIATGRNSPIGAHDPTAHAEIVALRVAALALGNYRLGECEMFVTLEPCAMCSGAMLHARLKRVVFGASDAKTGAAGSVINLFTQPQLNHQTTLQGGVLAEQCSALLQDFFRLRRASHKEDNKQRHPLRDDALRTPDSAFQGLPDYPWSPHYVSDLPALGGLRLHYLDEAGEKRPKDDEPMLTYLCLHGPSSWSYQFRTMMSAWLNAGHRVVAPDLIGFGKSDKPKKDRFHTLAVHRQILLELVEKLDLKNLVLVLEDGVDLLGRTLPMAAPQRYGGLLVMNALMSGSKFSDWPELPEPGSAGLALLELPTQGTPEQLPMNAEMRRADSAPFPDQGHRAAMRAFSLSPSACQIADTADWADISREASQFWRERWAGQSLMVVSSQAPQLADVEVPGVPMHDEYIAAQALKFFYSARLSTLKIPHHRTRHCDGGYLQP